MNLPALPSREVWHALNHALPRHPLLWFPWDGKDDLLPPPQPMLEAAPTALLVSSGLITLVGWLVFGVTPMVLVLLVHGYVGMAAARSVAGTIGQVRRRGLYDLMGSTPPGALAAGWAVAVRCFRRNRVVQALSALPDYLRLVWVMALTPYSLLTILSLCQGVGVSPTPLQQLFGQPLAVMNGFIVLVVMSLDQSQALATGGLLGIIAPTLQTDRFEAQVSAPLLFITYQALNTALILALHASAFTLTAPSIDPLLRPWASSVLWLGVFIVIREGGVLTLCAVLAGRSGASLRDVLTIYRRSI